MTSRDFAYWLQGFFEISGDELQSLDKPKIDMIQKHLNMVFVHEIDPTHGDAEKQAVLDFIHNPKIEFGPGPTITGQGSWPPTNGTPIARC